MFKKVKGVNPSWVGDKFKVLEGGYPIVPPNTFVGMSTFRIQSVTDIVANSLLVARKVLSNER